MQGLEVFDESGNLQFSATDRVCRKIGVVSTGSANGSIQMPTGLAGEFIGTVSISGTADSYYAPNVYFNKINGITTMSWVYPQPTAGTPLAIITYWVY